MSIVYVKDGKEIPGDSWVPFEHPDAGSVTCQPVNMTANQMTLAGVTTAPLQPVPDEFYGPVVKDPENPGGWIQSPYPPEEMQLRLHDYSAQIRAGVEMGGMLVLNGAYATASTRDVRAMYTTGSHNASKKDITLTSKVYAVVDGIPANTPTFVKMSKKELDQTDTDLMEFADNCFATEADVSNLIVDGTITTKEEIEATYAPLKQRQPKLVPRS